MRDGERASQCHGLIRTLNCTAVDWPQKEPGRWQIFVPKLPRLFLPYLEYEPAHLGESGAALLEAVEVVLGEDEVALLPPREELVPLLPEEALLLRPVLAIIRDLDGGEVLQRKSEKKVVSIKLSTIG